MCLNLNASIAAAYSCIIKERMICWCDGYLRLRRACGTKQCSSWTDRQIICGNWAKAHGWCGISVSAYWTLELFHSGFIVTGWCGTRGLYWVESSQWLWADHKQLSQPLLTVVCLLAKHKINEPMVAILCWAECDYMNRHVQEVIVGVWIFACSGKGDVSQLGFITVVLCKRTGGLGMLMELLTMKMLKKRKKKKHCRLQKLWTTANCRWQWQSIAV